MVMARFSFHYTAVITAATKRRATDIKALFFLIQGQSLSIRGELAKKCVGNM
jgi:hypothetical protein